MESRQGDQIGRIYWEYWAVSYFGQFFESTEVAQNLGLPFPRCKLCINYNKKGLGYILGNFFHKLIRSPWKQARLDVHLVDVSRNWWKSFWHVTGEEVVTRVARFFLVHKTKTGQTVPKEHKLYQVVIEYPKCPWNVTGGRKIYQHFPIYSKI
jgi:hypothetical protein